MEASQSSVPLLLLTADRAPESRYTGANQAIPQPGIFGQFVRHASDLPCPTDELPVCKNYILLAGTGFFLGC